MNKKLFSFYLLMAASLNSAPMVAKVNIAEETKMGGWKARLLSPCNPF